MVVTKAGFGSGKHWVCETESVTVAPWTVVMVRHELHWKNPDKIGTIWKKLFLTTPLCVTGIVLSLTGRVIRNHLF